MVFIRFSFFVRSFICFHWVFNGVSVSIGFFVQKKVSKGFYVFFNWFS